MRSVASQYKKSRNAHLEALAREVEIETNKRRQEIMQLRQNTLEPIKRAAPDSRS